MVWLHFLTHLDHRTVIWSHWYCFICLPLYNLYNSNWHLYVRNTEELEQMSYIDSAAQYLHRRLLCPNTGIHILSLCWVSHAHFLSVSQGWTTVSSSTFLTSRERRSAESSFWRFPIRIWRSWRWPASAIRSWFWRLWICSAHWSVLQLTQMSFSHRASNQIYHRSLVQLYLSASENISVLTFALLFKVGLCSE